MLRISEIPGDPGHSVTLRLEGRAIGPWVPELGRIARASVAQYSRVTLDLAAVTFLDPGAIALLLDLEARGCVLAGPSSFVDAQLRARSAP
ncbi:MAG: hypothetical protein IPK07_03725 [Deltaproteobacteria bacterium]|nr:hypothetical protein [Deltaproteobacteria bacterium]